MTEAPEHPDSEDPADAIARAAEASRPKRILPPLDQQLSRMHAAALIFAPSPEAAEAFMADLRPWVETWDDYANGPEARHAVDIAAVRLHRQAERLGSVPALLRRIEAARAELSAAHGDLQRILSSAAVDLQNLDLVGYIHLSQQPSFKPKRFGYWQATLERMVLPCVRAATKTIRDPRGGRPTREPAIYILTAAAAGAAVDRFGFEWSAAPDSQLVRLLEQILEAAGVESHSPSTVRDILRQIRPNLRRGRRPKRTG